MIKLHVVLSFVPLPPCLFFPHFGVGIWQFWTRCYWCKKRDNSQYDTIGTVVKIVDKIAIEKSLELQSSAQIRCRVAMISLASSSHSCCTTSNVSPWAILVGGSRWNYGLGQEHDLGSWGEAALLISWRLLWYLQGDAVAARQHGALWWCRCWYSKK